MSALRKAGVWLGLVEEEDDDRGYDDRGYRENGYRERESSYRAESRYDDFGDEDDEDDEPPVPRARTSERVRPASSRTDHDREERAADRAAERASVRSITRSPAPESSTSYPTRDNLALSPQVQVRERPEPQEDQRYSITTLHPTTYREARTIGEHFRDGTPVIINLTEMDEGDARRLVDFAAGLAFGLRGTIERVTNRVFLLSPANVQVTAEDKAKIAEGGFFNQS
jgi:cell division inhibitor SepF